MKFKPYLKFATYVKEDTVFFSVTLELTLFFFRASNYILRQLQFLTQTEKVIKLIIYLTLYLIFIYFE